MPTPGHLEAVVSQWIGRGCELVHKDGGRARLARLRRLRKRWMLASFLLGGIGLLIYLATHTVMPRWETVDVLAETASPPPSPP